MADDVDSSAISSSCNYNNDLTKCTFPIKTYNSNSRYKKLYKFPDVENMDDLPKLAKEESYWHHLLQKRGAIKYSKEYIRAKITRKIEKIGDYFNRLQTNRLTENEIEKKKPQNFLGLYFPSPKEIQILISLDIDIGWEIPAKHQKFNIARDYPLSRMEKIYLIKRWKQFQKKYKFYDLRPLLGVRCGTYEASIGFTFFRMINHETRFKFLQFMAKGLPFKGLAYVERYLATLCDQFLDGKFNIVQRRPHPRGKEFCCIVELYDQYGFESPPIIELIIGKLNKIVYRTYIKTYLVIKHIPIKCSAWQKEDDLTLIKKVYNNKSIVDIFNEIKTRTPSMILCREIHLKKALASIQANLPINGQIQNQWTDEDNIKMITLVYNSKAETMRDIDWVEMAEKFTGFCHFTLREKFHFLMKTRIPTEKQKCFDEALEFLYHNVTPIYKIKHTRQRRLKKDLSYVKDLCKSSKEALALSQYFNTVDLRDDAEECQIILSCETPYSGYSTAKKKKDVITLDEDEIVLLSDDECDSSLGLNDKAKTWNVKL